MATKTFITGESNIRDILKNWPQIRAILEEKGLMGCGGEDGPDERLDLFAQVHHVDLATLVGELNASIAEGAGKKPEVARQPSASDTLYQRFVVTALLGGLLIGTLFGMIYLQYLRTGSGLVQLFQLIGHGHFQVFILTMGLIMGVGYHVIPRFLGRPLQAVRAARFSFLTYLASAITWGAITIFGGDFSSTQIWITLGSASTLVTALLFAWVFFSTRRGTSARPGPYLAFVQLGTIGFVTAAAVDLISAFSLVRMDLVVYSLAIFLGILPWTFGMTLRAVANFMGLKDPRNAMTWLAFWCLLIGTVFSTIGQLGWLLGPEAIGIALIGISSILFIAGSRIFEKPAFAPDKLAFPFVGVVKAAFVLLLFFAIDAIVWTSYSLSIDAPERGLIQDATRHALTTGYLLLLMTAVMGRIFPIFSGKTLRLPRFFTVGAVLIAMGALLRQSQMLAVFAPGASVLEITGFSGYVGFAGLAISVSCILLTLTLKPKSTPTSLQLGPDDLPTADHTVAEILSWHPDAIEVLASAGFGALRNPLLRSTMAKTVTLRQACSIHKRDVNTILHELHKLPRQLT